MNQSFEFYDPTMDVRITGGNLPHWFQSGVTYFITFRTADSLPKNVVELWLRRRNDWLKRHVIDAVSTRDVSSHKNGACRMPNTSRSPHTPCAEVSLATRHEPTTHVLAARLQNLPAEKQREFHSLFSREFMNHLDRGYGECVLKQPALAKIVAENLWYNNGKQYQLGDFVIMPNHVHVLVCLLGKNDLQRQCYSWKKYTASQINQTLGRRGRFWQEESFDHLVRNPEQFDSLRRYIADNPSKACLQEGEYFYWRHPM